MKKQGRNSRSRIQAWSLVRDDGPAPAGSRPGGHVAHVATPGPLATTPENTARANGGPRGRHLPDCGQAAMSPSDGAVLG
jgi:hypothetical protein